MEAPRQFESDSSAGRMASNGLFTAMQFAVYTLAGVIFIPYLVRWYGTGAYGLIALAGFLTQYVGLIQRCVGNSVARFLNIALNRNDWIQANEILNTALAANVLLILVQVPVFALAVWKLDLLFDFSPEQASDFRILLICNISAFFITMLTGVISTPIQAANRLEIITTADSIRILVRITLLVLLIKLFGAKLAIIGCVDLGLTLLNLVVMAIMSWKIAPDLKLRSRYITRKWVRPVLNMTGWTIVTTLGGYMFVKTDIWMVNRFVDKEIAGVYAALLVWPNFLRQVSKQLASVLVPVYMIDFAKGNLDRIARLSLSSAKMLGCFVGFCVGILAVITEPLLELWLGAGSAQYAMLLRVMLFYLTFTIGEAVLWQIYTTLNKVHFTGLVSISAGALNIVISLGLIYAGYGVMGVAIGTAIAQLLASALAVPIGVCREFKISVRTVWMNYLNAALMCAAAAIAGYIGLYFMNRFNVVAGVAALGVAAVIGGFLGLYVILSSEERRMVMDMLAKVRRSLFGR